MKDNNEHKAEEIGDDESSELMETATPVFGCLFVASMIGTLSKGLELFDFIVGILAFFSLLGCILTAVHWMLSFKKREKGKIRRIIRDLLMLIIMALWCAAIFRYL